MLYPRLSANIAPDVELEVFLLAAAAAVAASSAAHCHDVFHRAYAEIHLDGHRFDREFAVCSAATITESVKAEAYRKAVQYLQASGNIRSFLPLRNLEWKVKNETCH
ncbi:hypothetical protein F183_A43730 [Bryobacterales bacterium F-183]|nr:hypothetical protein F183_A43730 [Bryobacterales bacterium F-183]